MSTPEFIVLFPWLKKPDDSSECVTMNCSASPTKIINGDAFINEHFHRDVVEFIKYVNAHCTAKYCVISSALIITDIFKMERLPYTLLYPTIGDKHIVEDMVDHELELAYCRSYYKSMIERYDGVQDNNCKKVRFLSVEDYIKSLKD